MVPPPLRPDQYPPIASVHELEDLSRAVRRCTEAASTRAGSARAALEYFGQAIKPGGSVVDPSSSLISSHKRESGTPSRRDRDDDEFEIGGSRRRNGVERHGSLVSDGPTIGRPKKSHALSHQVVAATDVGGTNRLTPGLGDSKREMEKPGRGRKAINGSAATGAASGSRNSVSPVRIKREISASPAPSTVAYNDAGSVHGSLASTSQRNKNARSPSVLSADGPDIPLSQSSGHKKKKRKIAYGDDNGASAASVDGGRSGRLGSPSASVRSNTSAQHGASVSASAKDRPVVSHQSSSNLKIKLKVGGPDAAAASLATTPEPVYHHPVINFQPPPLPTFALPPEAYRPSSSVAPPEPISLDSPSKMTNPHLPTADSLPVSSLIPTRQAVPRPPAPGPKRQKDVNQDFTQVKSVPQQTSWNTFWAGIEPYLREIGPEDLAMLRLEQDNVTPFVVPPLGKHYQDLWDEEDLNLPFGASSSSASNALGGLSASAAAAQAARESRMASRRGKFIAPRDMADDDLADDTRGLGGLTERIASAFFPDELAVKLKTEEGEKQRETEADHSHANGEKEVEPGAATVDLTSPVRETRPLADTTDRGRSPVKQEPGGDNKAEDLKITEVADDDDNDNDDLDDYQWPIAPHRIPSPARKPGERDRADVVGVDINDLEEGVKREMRLLQLIGPEEQVSTWRSGFSIRLLIIVFVFSSNRNPARTTKSPQHSDNVSDFSANNPKSTKNARLAWPKYAKLVLPTRNASRSSMAFNES